MTAEKLMTLTLTADNGDVIWADPNLVGDDFTADVRGRTLMNEIRTAISEYAKEEARTLAPDTPAKVSFRFKI